MTLFRIALIFTAKLKRDLNSVEFLKRIRMHTASVKQLSGIRVDVNCEMHHQMTGMCQPKARFYCPFSFYWYFLIVFIRLIRRIACQNACDLLWMAVSVARTRIISQKKYEKKYRNRIMVFYMSFLVLDYNL